MGDCKLKIHKYFFAKKENYRLIIQVVVPVVELISGAQGDCILKIQNYLSVKMERRMSWYASVIPVVELATRAWKIASQKSRAACLYKRGGACRNTSVIPVVVLTSRTWEVTS